MSIIEEIKKSKSKLYLAITGGGTEAISHLCKGGGASSVFLGATVPYSETELAWVIGSYDKAVSQKVADKLCKETPTYTTVESLRKEDGFYSLYCIGCTSSLTKGEKQREGRENVAFISIKLYTNVPEQEKVIFRGKIVFNTKNTRETQEANLAAAILDLADCYMNLRKAHPWTNPDSIKAYKKLGMELEQCV